MKTLLDWRSRKRMQKSDVVIIGAGPAGLSAAIQCREHNLNVVVLDEFPKAGGRLLGQLHEEPNGEWWNGIEQSQTLIDQINELHIDLLLLHSVHHIEPKEDEFIVHTTNGSISTETVLVATGAAESAAPIPGWTLPGVMS